RGFYHSDDLVTWTFVDGANLPIKFGAPDIREIGGWLYQCSSGTSTCSIFRTRDPLAGEWEEVSSPFAFWDPNLFEDGDGRVYLYWGCSNVTPIWGVEMDKQTLLPIGERVVLIEGRPDIHGWERLGTDNDNSQGYTFPGEIGTQPVRDPRPWIEGAWMTKHDGRYYLQYSAPGTEFNVYADGVYVGDSPLGPFAYSIDSPLSSKPGGFIPGAGHGSTLQDKYGNWWHISSMVVSVNEAFERRVGLFPTGFDRDGVMYCNMNYADYPMRLPQSRIQDPWQDCFPGWMLLSYKKSVSASSECTGYPKENLTDESIRTRWAAGTRKPGESVTINLDAALDVRAVQINFAEHNLAALLTLPGFREQDMTPEQRATRRIRWLLEGSADGRSWEILCDKRAADTDLPHDLVVMKDGKKLRYIKLTGYEMPYSGAFALSGLRVFGHAGGAVPKSVTKPEAIRLDPMSARIRWTPVDDCDGYNIRWGTAPDKLYHSWMVYDCEKSELTLRQLSAGVDCCVAVDTFNGSGITAGACVKAGIGD
ncbi:MAG TPA: family 43 glycosylhydrolase, partial [Clostridia bacterium]